MIREIDIELDNFRVINALVDISWSNYAPSEFASGYSECSWKCLSLTEVTEDGTIIKHHIPDYYSRIEEIISNL